jgi:hypothetical protein
MAFEGDNGIEKAAAGLVILVVSQNNILND